MAHQLFPDSDYDDLEYWCEEEVSEARLTPAELPVPCDMCDEDKEYIRRAEEGLQLEKNRLRLGEEYLAPKEKIKADRVRLRTELSSLVDLYECQVEVAESALDRLNRAKIGYFGVIMQICDKDEE